MDLSLDRYSALSSLRFPSLRIREIRTILFWENNSVDLTHWYARGGHCIGYMLSVLFRILPIASNTWHSLELTNAECFILFAFQI